MNTKIEFQLLFVSEDGVSKNLIQVLIPNSAVKIVTISISNLIFLFPISIINEKTETFI